MDHYPAETNKTPEGTHPRMVLLFLGALIFLFMMLGAGVIAFICELQGIDMESTFKAFNMESPPELRNFMRGTLLINHMLTFMVPALLAGWFFFKRKWPVALGVRFAPPLKEFGLGILMMAATFPLAQVAFFINRWIVQKIPFLQELVDSETATENMMEGLLVMPSAPEMLFSILVMAVVPAIGEELVFRGFIQKQLERWLSNPYVAILVAALVFGIAHFQIQRFFAIFLLGIVLGLLYFWTRNLWISIAGHLMINGSQVVMAYFNQEGLEALNSGEGQAMPWALTVCSLAAVILIARKLMPPAGHAGNIFLKQ